MQLKEIKEAIAASPQKDWLQQYTIEFKFPHINYSTSLTGVAAIFEFILNQIEGYDAYGQLPRELEAIKKRFVAVRDNMVYLITNNSNRDHDWKSNLGSIINNSPLVFLANTPETDFLIKLNAENPKHYKGAFDYFSGVTNQVTTKDFFIGYLLAYEFSTKDSSLITERKEAEKKSISRIRADFQKNLAESETQFIEIISQARQKSIDYAAKIDELKKDKEDKYSEWFNEVSTSFTKFSSESNSKVKHLEDLYIDKLKLEAPAQYWNKRAAKLRKEGRNWLVGMLACLAVSVITLICILNMVADGTLQKIFSETSTAIKWSVAFITLISFLAYGLRTFAKLTFSSFHLVRDAEEREQLTYVYLALKKEQQVDQTERHLIMQSLFSRADSGLLKDDSGPTMPGNIVDGVIKK